MVEARSTGAPPQDPAATLGVSPDAADEEIRAAYLARVKEHPPELGDGEFERIRDAYDLLRDPRQRALLRLLAADPTAPLAGFATGPSPRREFVGPELWLAVIKEET